MTDRDTAPDREVGQWFRALRQEDRGGAPPFAATVDRAYARRIPRPGQRRVALAVAALVVGAALVLFVARTRSPRPALDLASVHILTPTDFLLRLPGADLLRSVPALGGFDLPTARLLTTPTDRRTP
jgi:hypothetical protein